MMSLRTILLMALATLLAQAGTAAAAARALQQTVDATMINNALAAYQRDPQGTANALASRATCPPLPHPGMPRRSQINLLQCSAHGIPRRQRRGYIAKSCSRHCSWICPQALSPACRFLACAAAAAVSSSGSGCPGKAVLSCPSPRYMSRAGV